MSLAEDLWQELVEMDDRTSPEEYPDHALITREEFFGFLAIVREEAAKVADVYHVGLKGIGARGWGQIHTARNISRDIRQLEPKP